jgi:hypothetical protein
MVSALPFLASVLAILPSLISASPIKTPRQASIPTAQDWINENFPGKYGQCTTENMEVRRDW